MRINELINYIHELSPQVVSWNGRRETPNQLERINEETCYNSDTTYIGYLSEVRPIFRFISNCTLLLIEDVEIKNKESLHDSGNRILLFPNSVSMEQIQKIWARCVSEQENFYRNIYELTAATLDGAPLREITNLLASTIGNPVILLDNNYQVVETSDNLVCSEPEWQQILQQGYVSYGLLSELLHQQNRLIGQLPVLTGYFSSMRRLFLSRLTHEHVQTGFMLSIESARSFTEIDIQYIQMASKMLFSYISEETESYDDSRQTVQMMSRILDGRVRDRQNIIDSLSHVNMKGSVRTYIMVLDLRGYHSEKSDRDQLQLLKDMIPGTSLSFWYHEELVVYIEYEGSINELRRKLTELGRIFCDCGVRSTVSDWFVDPTRIAFFYRQAKRAAKLAVCMNSIPPIFFYEDVRRLDILTRRQEDENLEDMVGPEYLQMMQYDMDNHTEYFDTLFQYIQAGKNYGRAAEYLFVHKNTVAYRIKNMREIFPFDLENDLQCTTFLDVYLCMKLKENHLMN